MELVADLHLHGKYSRAVSRQMDIEHLARWGRFKGVDLLAAPDWTHPLFLKELKNDLIESGEGVYAYFKDKNGPQFILATEIACIYSQKGKGRRIHLLVLAPSLVTVEKINRVLKKQGANLESDGRPIIGLSARCLADLVLNIDRRCLLIPSHIWTPWYGLYGSRSGFESLSEAFGALAGQISAIETGLSSDPAMNWRLKELNNRSILSFSDAHSPAKIGREATVFSVKDNKKLRYEDIRQAITGGGEKRNESSSRDQVTLPGIAYTVEFYPQEGKYHHTGHRRCGVVHTPEQAKKLGNQCPVCGKTLTQGVMQRVEELVGLHGENESENKQQDHRPPYVMLIPLIEIISEVYKIGIKSKKVVNEYNNMTKNIGHELQVLLNADLGLIARKSHPKIAEAIGRVRQGKVHIQPGYDGLFGQVSIWSRASDSARRYRQNNQLNIFEKKVNSA